MAEPTKQQLLDAALRVYAECGFRGATTRRIAEEAGVNEVTLFRQFGSKAALIEAAVEHASTLGVPKPLPLDPADPERELTAWAQQNHAFMLEMRSMIRTSMAEMHERPECADTAASKPAAGYRDLNAYIEALAAKRLIPSATDAKPAAAMLIGTIFADAMGRDLMPDMFPPEKDAPAAYVRLFLRAIGAKALALLLVLAPVAPAVAQGTAAPAAPTAGAATPLSLGEALQMAERRSSNVRIAEAGAARAAGQMRQADSQLFPQVNGTASYQRAIQNQFAEISERFAQPDTGSSSGGDGLANSPLAQIFAAPNTFVFGISATQNLWTGGKVSAARAGARAASDAATIQLSSTRAQALLDVAQAYYDAVASERFAAIADSTLELTERTLKQVELARSVGTASEFDLLRARVTRDNARPAAIQARGTRTASHLRLKQLLELPLPTPLTLTTSIRDDATLVTEMLAPVQVTDTRRVAPDTSVGSRSVVRQAQAQLEASERALTAARLSRLPALQLSTIYQRFAYPPDGTFLPSSLDLYFPNWNVTLGLSFPIFNGGRLAGERAVAEANVMEARARVQQAREGAALDALLALVALEQAQAAYVASIGTDAQAEQAYRIAEVRFAEGLSTPVELTESRVQLQQARLQRVTTARDLEIARLRLGLLKDLPLSFAGAR